MMQPWVPEVYSIPLHVLIIWLLLVITLIVNFRLIIHGLTIFSIVHWSAILILGVSILVRSALDDWDFLRFIQLLTGIIIAIFGGIVFQNQKARRIILISLSLGVVVSCTIAVLQYFEISHWLWQKSKYARVGYVYGSTGMENCPVSFSYSILGIGMTLISIWLIQWRHKIKLINIRGTFLFLSNLIVLIGLIVSNSRSGLLGIAVGILVTVGCSRKVRHKINRTEEVKKKEYIEKKYHYLKLHSFMTVLFATMIVSGLIYFSVTARNATIIQDARIFASYEVYLPVILNNPLGIPKNVSKIDVFEDIGSSYSEIQEKLGGSVIAPHNLFLTTGVTFGPVAAVALFILYFSALYQGRHTFNLLLRTNLISEAFWILILVSANICIITHSWFHNANLAIGEMRNWLWLGMLFGALQSVNIVKSNNYKGVIIYKSQSDSLKSFSC